MGACDMTPKQTIAHAAKFPYDGGEVFWSKEGGIPLPAKDKAHLTARGILNDLWDRRGIKWELEQIDHATRAEIVEAVAEIIRVGMT